MDDHRMKPALFSIFCEIKERTCLNYNQHEVEDPPDPQLLRLDNMLIAEGVAGKGNAPIATNPEVTIQNSEYKAKLVQIRYGRAIHRSISRAGPCTTKNWKSTTLDARSSRRM